jgi:hypothetical protein
MSGKIGNRQLKGSTSPKDGKTESLAMKLHLVQLPHRAL